MLDIDDDDCSNLRLSHVEWTLLLGEMCPTLHRDREPLASVSEVRVVNRTLYSTCARPLA